ncbi:MAG: hypothetical protein J2P44_00960 [Candidatus Dormibacteraeota bacterium]|nr:hypothetical protein [Candidatus Dormibacteraeota bacterium]
MRLHPEEPLAGPWHVEPLVEVFEQVLGIQRLPRLAVVAIDGRSSAGKTSLAARASAVLPNSSVVHTDDVAWHSSAFHWTQLLVEGVLEPARGGGRVSYRPAAWDERSRGDSIEIPAGTRLLLLEGVGASRRELRGFLDGALWVQTDLDEALARDRVRVAAGEIGPEAYEAWMAEETEFIADQRPWEHANLVIAGSSCDVPMQPNEVLVAEPHRADAGSERAR